MSIHACFTGLTISDANPVDHAAFPGFVLLIDCLTMTWISLRKTIFMQCILCVFSRLLFFAIFLSASLTANTP